MNHNRGVVDVIITLMLHWQILFYINEIIISNEFAELVQKIKNTENKLVF